MKESDIWNVIMEVLLSLNIVIIRSLAISSKKGSWQITFD